ncbi:uncharacterized protein LOC115014618 [Cottoperca gobio]|uniref:Uncharacterized protein LOC115014618 n=1 Tax=Cottoperca gobio TaxID=56716 RepID=A0A6J2QGD3_COTGO|nr:uncharacterized protein LOC115014618 [Cottoperca gobio]XP_029297474.1 uncharacterized protein LOC115014618 [Cottoperca gobio]XP_029297475.1 uncharacterized protein LOC115014618 [Cottoperca gobio]
MGRQRTRASKFTMAVVHYTDLTERDAGTFSVSNDNSRRRNIVKLNILECAEKNAKYYGDKYSTRINQAEYLEFTPLHSVDLPKVVWNLTDPQTNEKGRWQVKFHIWELKNLNQADAGYYNFRAKDKTLLKRILLEVKVHHINYDAMENTWLLIDNPSSDILWTVTFTPDGKVQKKTLIEKGHLITQDEWISEPWTLPERIQVLRNGITIHSLEVTDSGTFEFIDLQGHLTKTAMLLVKHEPDSTIAIVGIAVGIFFGVIICCCCVKRCCCKKSSSKREDSAPQTATTPAVYYHDVNQPAGPHFTAAPAPNYSYQPMNSLVSREATTISPDPPVYNPVNIHVNPLQLQVEPLGGLGIDPAPTLGSDCLSSDRMPTFEFETSTLPLSAETTFSHVYTSDKLNFL